MSSNNPIFNKIINQPLNAPVTMIEEMEIDLVQEIMEAE